jgi:hypothetical protein
MQWRSNISSKSWGLGASFKLRNYHWRRKKHSRFTRRPTVQSNCHLTHLRNILPVFNISRFSLLANKHLQSSWPVQSAPFCWIRIRSFSPADSQSIVNNSQEKTIHFYETNKLRKCDFSIFYYKICVRRIVNKFVGIFCLVECGSGRSTTLQRRCRIRIRSRMDRIRQHCPVAQLQ